MNPVLMQTPRVCWRPGLAALVLALLVAPVAHAAEKFSVRATLTPVPVQQTSGTYTLKARLGRAQMEKTEHLGSTFALTATMSPLMPMVCYGDTIFRDGFGYP